MDSVTFTSQYGSAVVTLVGPVIPIEDVSGEAIIDAGHGFDLETAEKLALITENARTQLSYNFARKRCYMMLHHSSSTVQVCQVDSVTYCGSDPAGAVLRLNKDACPFL